MTDHDLLRALRAYREASRLLGQTGVPPIATATLAEWWAPGPVEPPSDRLASRPRAESKGALARRYVADHPWITSGEVGRATGITSGQASAGLQQGLTNGSIIRVDSGRRVGTGLPIYLYAAAGTPVPADAAKGGPS